ncbi:sugar MFS transporter [Larkinella soli]|uniref:sugar MFS transporter n=1 Tax=Larkinella soli TaxID=1770527 RepID=UPI000FFC8322|nr:sugar MFS transporter [Larkinella soli]
MAHLPARTAGLPATADPESRSYTPALISLSVLYFMMGFITCLNDTLVPFFKKGFSLSYAQSSLVQFYFFLTYGLMSVPAGRIVGKTGYKRGMVAGFGMAAVGALLFYPASLLHEYSLFLAALFILAVGIVLLQVAANPYITVLGPARTASSRLTLIQGVGSVGTTTAPVFGAWFLLGPLRQAQAGSEAVRYPYLGIAALLLVIALAVGRLRLPAVGPAKPDSTEAEPRSMFGFRNLRFGIGGIFFYVGAEVTVGTFLTNYIADTLAIPESEANGFVSFYWGGMLVGRLAGAWLLQRIRPQNALAFCAAAAFLLIGVSVGTAGYVAVWSLIAVGLFNSVMFAIIFSLSVSGLGRYTTRASGLLSTAIAGGAVVSYFQGVLIDLSGWAVAFSLPMLCYIYILFYGLDGYKTNRSGSGS